MQENPCCVRHRNKVVWEVDMSKSIYWVKEMQTPEERRAKYKYLRKCGLSVWMARRARDWTKGHICMLIKALCAIGDKKVCSCLRETSREKKRLGKFSYKCK